MDPNQIETDAEQLINIWTEPQATPPVKDDAAREQQIAQAEAQIAAEQKQIQANDAGIAGAEARAAAIELDLARLEGREEELEK